MILQLPLCNLIISQLFCVITSHWKNGYIVNFPFPRPIPTQQKYTYFPEEDIWLCVYVVVRINLYNFEFIQTFMYACAQLITESRTRLSSGCKFNYFFQFSRQGNSRQVRAVICSRQVRAVICCYRVAVGDSSVVECRSGANIIKHGKVHMYLLT